MTGVADFLEIPVRDDANEFASLQRGFDTLECLTDISCPIEGRHVVDLGAGFGSLSIAASLSGAASVLAVDIHPDRLAAIETRAARHDARVATRVANLLAPWSEAPGESEADVADLALLFGVVEYAGLWDDSQEPRSLQRTLFATARQALRPGGKLVVGTKNRAWPAFAVRDVHTGMAVVNALPRRTADRVSMRRSGAPYRHHLHTPRGWAALLSEAGFAQVETYVPYMSYQFPIKVVRKPKFSDLADVRGRAPRGERRRAAVGRAPTLKMAAMAAGYAVGLPISHSVVLVATA